MTRALAPPLPRRSLPAWSRPAHPVFGHEARRWKRGGAWRALRRAWWTVPVVLAFGLVAGGCTGAVSLRGQASAVDVALVAGSTFVFFVVAVSALMNWLLGLAASILGASLIARERETQTWTFLRVTTLSSAEIVGGKLAALLHLLVNPAHAIMALRVFALAGGALALAYAASASGLTAPMVGDILSELDALVPAPTLALAILVGGLDVAVWLAYWLVEPYFNLLYNSAIGLTASTLVRTRGLAIGAAFIVHLGLGLVVYAPVQQIGYSALAVGLSTVGDPTGSLLTTAIMLSVQFGLQIALQVGVLLACLLVALARVDRLSD